MEFLKPAGDEIIRQLQLESDAMVLDIAAGTGEILRSLLVSQVQASLDRRTAPSSRMVAYHKSRIQNVIREELSNPALDMTMIAQSVGLSQRYIHRLYAGESMHLMQSVWALRLDRCCEDMQRPELAHRSISAIAYSWGFNDSAHFSRSFRKRFGVSPSVLRRQSVEALPSVQLGGHVNQMVTFEHHTFHS